MTSINSQEWLCIERIVRFGDTDGAGIIHFHNIFRWCHEAWEESLDNYGLKAIDIFPSASDRQSYVPIALPIVHCEADFFSPIRTGDRLTVYLLPKKLDRVSFDVEYRFQDGKKNVAIALIRHCAIDVESRHKCDLPSEISRWIEASTLNTGITVI